ncbi:MAG: dynamin family protein [Polyangiaceae bacterium]|jgi:tRNA U34 5-carboxymethylaminomethyl modifying GTPase MnmE/TrmE
MVSESGTASDARTFDRFLERRDEVVAALHGLSEVAAALGTKTLRERVNRELVRKLEEDRFHLVVVGEFNHGKTTFVNALLGQRALPVGVTPTTAAIHHIRWAERPEAVVVGPSGERRAIPFEEAKRFSVGGGAATEEVDYLEIGYPAPLLKERILLVDTPGVNDLALQRSDITYSYIPRADAVLFLLDAGQILKESERVFLHDKLLKGSRDKIVFVITKWDLLSPDERREAFAYATSKLSTLVHHPVVFAVSAEAALAGHAAESGLPELVIHLTRFLAEERGRILLDNALGEGLGAAALLSKGVDACRRSIQMETHELDRRIAALERDLAGQTGTIEQRRMQIREDVAGIKAATRKDLDRFVDDVCRQLPNVIDSAKPQDLRQFLPAFLEDAFKQWAEQETREIAMHLEQLAEKTIALVRDDARDSARRVAAVLGSDARRLDVHVDTIKYDVGVVALMFGGVALMAVNLMVGGVLAIAGPAIFAMFARGKIHEEFKRRAKELGPEVMRETAKKVGPKLDTLIEDFARKLDAWVVSAGEELHREVLEVLRATKEARSAGEHDEAKANAAVDAQAASLATVTERIDRLRRDLWPPAPRVRVGEAESA